jgi:multiple sugar transport system substrate-binding protein
MKQRVWCIVGALLVISTLSVFAGGSQGGEKTKVEISYWNNMGWAENRMVAFNGLVDRFMAEYPNIGIAQEMVSYPEMFPKTVPALKSGDLPDFRGSDPVLTAYTWEVGALLPVDDILKEIDSTEGYAISLEPVKYKGHYWSVPFTATPFATMYRPSILKASGLAGVPAEWDDYVKAAQKLTIDKDGDGNPEQFGVGLAGGRTMCTDQLLSSFVASAKGDWFDASGKPTFNSPEVVAALQMYKDMWQYTPPAASGWQWGEIEQNFSAGTFAMTPYLNPCLRQFFDAKNDDVGAAQIPHPAGVKPDKTIVWQSWDVHKVAKERGHLDALYTFFRYALKPENVWVLSVGMEPGHIFPATKSGLDLASEGYIDMEFFQLKGFFGDKQKQVYQDVMDTMIEAVKNASTFGFVHGPVNLAFGRICSEHVIEDMVQKAVVEGSSAAEAAAWAQAKAVKISEEY